tara:strand:+ start:167 stop:898 length:732 start_codon:yes stop_codon:yes gene_type:complete
MTALLRPKLIATVLLSVLPGGTSLRTRALDTRLASDTRQLGRRSLCSTALLALPAACAADTWLPKPLADARRKAEEKQKLEPPVVYNPEDVTILVQPTSEFLFVLNARRELDAVADKVGAEGYTPNDEDRVAIFQLLGFSFRPTSKLMLKMLEASPSAPLAAVRAADRAKGVELAIQFDTQLTAIADKNRERAPSADLAAVARGASSLLAGFLEVAATRYTVPAMPELVNAPTVFAPADSLKR